MMREVPKEPTARQCQDREKVYEAGGAVGYAMWYPQMGGYVGRAVVVFTAGSSGDCFDAYVWHDGEFPFTGEGGSPALVHHCDPAQFVSFGQGVGGLIAQHRPAA
jgi:hypothetical protein